MSHDQAGRGDIRTIANGLFPSGQDVSAIAPEGRDEVRAAVDALLRVWDRDSARLGLALEQLDKGAEEIERLRAALKTFFTPNHMKTLGEKIDDLKSAYGQSTGE